MYDHKNFIKQNNNLILYRSYTFQYSFKICSVQFSNLDQDIDWNISGIMCEQTLMQTNKLFFQMCLCSNGSFENNVTYVAKSPLLFTLLFQTIITQISFVIIQLLWGVRVNTRRLTKSECCYELYDNCLMRIKFLGNLW